MTPNLSSDDLMNTDVALPPATEGVSSAASWQNVGPAVMTRVDAPHEAANLAGGSAADEPATAVQLAPDESLSEQVSLQAAQLAAHLRGRQQELDHREAELNSRTARLECDARAARLWIDQHETDLTSREAELACRERDLAARFEAITNTEAALARRVQELSDRDQRLLQQEREVERRLARLATVEAAQQRGAPPPDAAKEEELRRAAEALESRRQQLEEAERRLARSQAETQELCEQLAADHAEFAERSAAVRQEVAAERRQAMADIEEKRRAVQRRGEQVDQRRAALEQLRAELERIHRETLEIRLATEEVWAQLSGVAPPAVLTQSLGRIRAKLAQQYAQANSDAAEQKMSLEATRGQLIAEHEKLIEQKRQFEQWAAACREECQQQASRLVAREQQLHNEKIELHQQWQRWQAERLRCQIELGRIESRASGESFS
jgi:chromosome segregation ATPase